MNEPYMEQFLNHMEFLGYTITREEKFARARHEKNSNLVAQPMKAGVLFSCFFSHGAAGIEDRDGYLKAINIANRRVLVARFYTDKDEDLVIESWYPGLYEKAAFGSFIDIYNRDIILGVGKETGLFKFLK